MLILKSASFSSDSKVAVFVNKNNIARENIVAITCGTTTIGDAEDFTIFFYGDPEVKEKMPGLFE
jgi:hypothetical protein